MGKKPLFIRIMGWLSLACLVLPVTVPLAQTLSGIHIQPTIWPGLVLAASVPCFILWLVGSLVHGWHTYRARMTAEQLQLLQSARAEDSRAKSMLGGGR